MGRAHRLGRLTLLLLDRRRVGIVLAVVAGVTLVAIAARGDHVERRFSWSLPSTATGTAQAMILILFGLLALGVLVLTIWSMFPDRGGSTIEPRRRKRSILGTLLGLALMFVVFAIAVQIGGDGGEVQRGRFAEPVSAPSPDARGEGSTPNWGLGAGGVVLLLGAAAVIALRRRPMAFDFPDEGPIAIVATRDERADAVEAAERCADPRRAVLLAFAAAEALLSADAATRRPAATSAREWAMTVRSRPLSTIVGRYEIARFSHHDVSEHDRRVALDALAALQ